MRERSRIFRFTVASLLAAGLAATAAGPAQAALGDCSQPQSNGAAPVASDCLFILRTAVGSETCTPECICNTNGEAAVTASDALICLNIAVGTPGFELNCPCDGTTSTTSTTLPGASPDLQDASYAFDPAVLDADIRAKFQATDYVGAFPQDVEPATGDWTLGWTISLHGNNTIWEPASSGTLAGAAPTADGSCPTGTTALGQTALPAGFAGNMDICQLAPRYATAGTTLTLTNDNIYRLGGGASQGTLIGNGDAAGVTPATAADVVLQIEPGTLILGVESEALAVTRGSDVFVNGTEEDPVVMSSKTWFDNWLAGGDGSSNRGEWGGFVVTGFGNANQCNSLTTCDALVEGYLNPFAYGGTDDADNSGAIQYLIVAQGGFDLDGNGSELNGFTLYALGYNTVVNHVQVHRSDDDGMEFFGGKVVADHVVLTGMADDSLDTDLGFAGGVQFGLIVQETDLADRGLEADNSPNPADEPVSTPALVNVTILGASVATELNPIGIIARSGSGGLFYNGIIVDSEAACIRTDDATLSQRGGVLADPDDGLLQIHNYAINCATPFEGEDGVIGNETEDVATWYSADPNNRVLDPNLNATGYPNPPAAP
jgi:hypothetical protein